MAASSGNTVTPAKQMAVDTEIVSVDLPAPEGWRKKFTPKMGGTPKRNEIVFISPTGEDITNKRQLDQYLRSHPGGPPASEFDWGTGDTPRRSSRLGAKTKATETPEQEKPKKRERRSASKKGEKDEDAEGQAGKANEVDKSGDEAPEEVKDAGASKDKKCADVEMENAQGHAGKTKEVDAAVEVVTEGATEKKSGETTIEDVEDGVVPSENDGHKDDRDDTVLKGHSSVNHQPKASPVNC